jgi:LysM domain
MVAILVPKPDDTTGYLAPAPWLPAPVRRRTVPSRARPVDLADVEPLQPRSVSKALPDRPTRIRRRRLVALLMTVALTGAIATAGRLLGAVSSVEPSSPQPVEVPALSTAAGETYVVQAGDTLWSIAAAIAPDSDPRPVVDALRAANGGPNLQVGQRLIISTD